MQMLNNLFKVGLELKNLKKSEKFIKIVNIDGENLHIF